MNRWLTYEHHLRRFKRISVVEPKLKSERFAGIECPHCALELNVPNVVFLVYDIEF